MTVIGWLSSLELLAIYIIELHVSWDTDNGNALTTCIHVSTTEASDRQCLTPEMSLGEHRLRGNGLNSE